jgi:hypothetical protein
MSAITLGQLLESYRRYLSLQKHRNPKGLALKRFEEHFRSHEEGAKTEAVTFEFLHSLSLFPRLHEDAATGGVDFECSFNGSVFGVEATALGDDKITQYSGLPNLPMPGVVTISPPSLAALKSRIKDKSSLPQVRRYAGPRVLAIGSTHSAASMLFADAPYELLIGETHVVFPVGPLGATGEGHFATEFNNAAHLRSSVDGGVQAIRQQYSLVLFLAVHFDGCHVTAMMNPQPEYPLPPNAFASLPIAKLQWPIMNNVLQVGWSPNGPRFQRHRFSAIGL